MKTAAPSRLVEPSPNKKGWKIQHLFRARNITADSPFLSPRLSHRMSRSVGDAAVRRADHAWSDLGVPGALNIPGEMPSGRERARRRVSKSRQCKGSNGEVL